MAQAGALATLDDNTILDRIAAGQHVAHIAPEFGVTKQALLLKLRDNPQYQLSREIGAEVRLDKAEAKFEDIDLEAANAALALAHARENFKAVSWRCEREFPSKWGNKSVVDVIHSDLGDRIRLARERVAAQQTPVEIDVTPSKTG